MHLYTGSNSPRFSPLGLNLNCEFFSQSPSFAWCNIIASQLLRTYITQPSWLMTLPCVGSLYNECSLLEQIMRQIVGTAHISHGPNVDLQVALTLRCIHS